MKPVILMSTIVLATTTPLLAAEKSYDFKGFTNVIVRGGVEVEIHSGEGYRVEADVSRRSLLRKLEIRQSGETLIIERHGPPSFFLMGLADHYDVAVSLPALEEVTAAAGSDVAVDGRLPAAVVATATSGADLDLEGVDAQNVSLTAASGADLTVQGHCETLTAQVSSGADLEAADLVCDRAALRASSGGDMQAHATEAAQANASSGGDIRLFGRAEVQDLRESSGGDVRPAG